MRFAIDFRKQLLHLADAILHGQAHTNVLNVNRR